jgi:hypothetical protein
MHIEKQVLPIVFIHIDDSDYLKLTLAQAKLSNPDAKIYLIGDEYNDNYAFVSHNNIKNYSSEAELFSKIYKHHSTNSYDGELFCFKRWFVLKEFMEHNSIQQCLYLDSDVLLYADIEKEYRKYSDCVFTLSYNYGLGFNIINDLRILNEFCDFIVKCFISQSFYQSLVAKAGPHGAVCDMLVFNKYQERTPYKIGDISLTVDQTKHDANINLSEGFDMEKGIKKVIWRDDKPYCIDIKSGSLIMFNSLHFQGSSKYLIKNYFKGELYYSEDRKKWYLKNRDADMNHYATHSTGSRAGKEVRRSSEKINFSGDFSPVRAVENIAMLLSSSNTKEARQAIEEAIDKYPLSPDLLALYAELKWETGEREDAQKILSYITGRWPDYTKSTDLLDVLSFHDNKWDYAAKLMQNALKLNPSEIWAIDIINKSIALIPDDSKTIFSLMQTVDELIKSNDPKNAREALNDVLFELAYFQIREPKRKGYPLFLADSVNKITHNLIESGFAIENYEIQVKDYHKYFQLAKYTEKFPEYYPFNLPEKSLEHFIAAQLLELNEKDTYIDIASEGSPAPAIYKDLFGTKTFRQDISYSSGFHGDFIGGCATNMPIPDNFATKIALHCSFEHLEGDADIGFIREAARVLKPGGSICIVPLYLAQEYSIVTDPVTAVSQNVAFENKSVVCCVKGLRNRFGRFYDPGTLKSRIKDNLENLKLKIFRITNAKFEPSCYIQFAALLTKPAIKK